jgi:hypothetical protein
MKIIIAIIFILISSVCYSHETKLIDSTGIVINKGDVFTKIVCLDGHKYVIIYTKNGVSITQMFEQAPRFYGLMPIYCKEKNE